MANSNRVIVLPDAEPRHADHGTVALLPQPGERGAELWERRLVAAVLAVDALAMLVAIGIAEVVRMSGPRTPTSLFRDLLLTGSIFVAWLGVLFLNRAYEPRFLGLGPEEYKRVFSAGTALLAAVATLSYADMAVTGRTLVVVALPLATAFALVGRYAVRSGVVRARTRGRCMHRVVVVGTPEGVADFVTISRKEVHAGLHVVGCCLPEASLYDPAARSLAGVPLLGSAHDVRRATLVSGATTIAITSSGAISGNDLRRLAWDLEGTGIDILVAPALTDIAGPRIHLRPVAGLPLIHLEEPEFEGGRQTVKGALDRVASLAALVLMMPVLAVVSLLVAFTSPGPVLFRQTRIGRNGQPFTMLKFRSMRHNAERQLADLQVSNENADGLLFKMKADPRITPLGKILRRFSLDELPQLINVLRGEMSLVGPRPPLETEVAQYGEDTARRLLVKPGLTGLWQISGRSDLPWDEAVRLDLHYVENWSIALDCLILWKTAFAVFARRGAY
ncbi:sugar transferase [Acidothermaceae bacterium B102]|nr:sugar transferase [Acidothermaceae bacterium B102]